MGNYFEPTNNYFYVKVGETYGNTPFEQGGVYFVPTTVITIPDYQAFQRVMEVDISVVADAIDVTSACDSDGYRKSISGPRTYTVRIRRKWRTTTGGKPMHSWRVASWADLGFPVEPKDTGQALSLWVQGYSGDYWECKAWQLTDMHVYPMTLGEYIERSVSTIENLTERLGAIAMAAEKLSRLCHAVSLVAEGLPLEDDDVDGIDDYTEDD